MNHTKLDSATALAQSFISSAHLIDEELHRYSDYLRDVRGLAMKKRALSKLHEPAIQAPRYRPTESLISFLKAL